MTVMSESKVNMAREVRRLSAEQQADRDTLVKLVAEFNEANEAPTDRWPSPTVPRPAWYLDWPR